MCLLNIKWQAKQVKKMLVVKSPKKWLKGYKVFHVHKKGKGWNPTICEYDSYEETIVFPHRHRTRYKSSIEIGDTMTVEPEEMVDIRSVELSSYGAIYKSGFHIFPSRMAARLYVGDYNSSYRCIYEVEYRKIVAQGEHKVYTQYPVDCDVALEMKIIGPASLPDAQEQKRESTLRKRVRL